MSMIKKTKNVALVLSSGGARGMAHIGVIEGLIENGYTITSIAGSSMGAVVGGVYATGQLEAYKKWLIQLNKLEVFRLIDFTFSMQGFIRGEKVFTEMKKFVKDKKIENLEIPFTAIACDIVNREEVVFDSGSLYTALRASAAIPSVIKPSVQNDIELVDGGVINPIPIEHVKCNKGDLIIVSDVNSSIPYKKPTKFKSQEPETETGMFAQFLSQWEKLVPPRIKNEKSKSTQNKLSYFELFNKSVNIMQDQISANIIERHKPDVLVKISRDACNTFEFDRAEELIEAGKLALNNALKTVEL